jgi:hypothetical protein
MTVRTSDCRPRGRAFLALLALTAMAAGCAEVGDTISPAFVDPAKYDLWDCKQLEPERKSIAARIEELQRMMAKAQTGAGGAVVSEMVYRNDYITARGQQKLAEETWRRNKCQETAASTPAPSGPAARPKIAPVSKSGGALQ